MIKPENQVPSIKGEQWKLYKLNYYVSTFGRVKRIGKKKERLIHPYVKSNKSGSKKMIFKCDGREVILSVAVYETFMGLLPNAFWRVHHKDNCYFNNDLVNLEALPLDELGKKTGFRSRRRLIYDMDNQCFYKGTREAAMKLGTNRQTISNYCNKKVKKPMFNIRWAKENE